MSVFPGQLGTDRSVEQTRSVQAVARAYVELTKPGIVKMVVLTAAIGFALAAMGANWDGLSLAVVFVSVLIGTALSAAGANTLNQAMEVRRDAAMARTMARPLPSRRISRTQATVFGVVLSVLGVAVLMIGANLAAAAVAAASSLTYLLLYTPSKPRTPLSTIIGSVPGALPPAIGYAAGATPPGGVELFGSFSAMTEPAAWMLFAIMFVWQVPHFLAIAWKYRAQYRDAGLTVLPAIDPAGVRTARAVVVWSVLLVAMAPLPAWTMPGLLGPISTVSAALLGALMTVYAVRLARRRSDAAAKQLFLASIAYLPLLLIAITVDAGVSAFGAGL